MLVLICGPSGVGKTSLMRALVARNQWPLVPTVTTRQSRPGELEKRQVTQEEYEKLEESGNLFTSNKLHGTWYGTLQRDISAAQGANTPHLLDFPFDKVSLYFADHWPLTLVLLPSSEEQLVHQLRAAGRSDRIAQAMEEYRILASLRRHSGLSPNVFLVANPVDDLNRAVLRAEEVISQWRRDEA